MNSKNKAKLAAIDLVLKATTAATCKSDPIGHYANKGAREELWMTKHLCEFAIKRAKEGDDLTEYREVLAEAEIIDEWYRRESDKNAYNGVYKEDDE